MVGIGVLAVILGLGLRAIAAPEWNRSGTGQISTIFPERPWAVEADCYSQLARVQRILHGQGLVQNHFAVENWPEGLTPSTTAPFDYAILLLYAPFTLFTQYPLDWAGALISPALWLALVLFWAIFPSREFNRVGRLLFVIGSAALPAFIWATAAGRPRHQSLILALMAIGLTAEYERWHLELASKRAWNIFSGIIWGLACWTSLFEPAFVVFVLVIYNLTVRRRESVAFLISFGVVMLIALLLEGPHLYVPPPEYYDSLHRWLSTIAEVHGINFTIFAQQMTFILFALPFLAWGLLKRPTDRRVDWLLLLVTILLCIFTLFQRRWIYYANLGELFLVVRYCQSDALRWSRLVVMALFVISLADAVHAQLNQHPGPNLPSPQMAKIAGSIDGVGGIMAPWWLSPGLLYFSGQPIVSGSSHCGISGIVASAKFFNATSWVEAERILQDRKVRWVVVMDDPAYEYPLVNTSRGILGLPFYTDDDKGDVESTVGQILVTDQMVPTSLQLRAVTPQLKLYEYLPEATP
jgi:hypothetical protein